ncbi:unnamed protein product [Moneuplotes crassus]|uniref:Casein kinase II subunit beta n=1 Tax=Euplotes crassus TaxID=5936 RepID=A0AAD2D4N7_EUPCR|nr:unnamed protein product [Moneuplotes crassus]
MTDTSGEGIGWIQWFCNIKDHHFLVEIEEDYIRDSFNLYGLRSKITNYAEALKMILSEESPESEDFEDKNFVDLYEQAIDLYGLIHARYILSPQGMQQMCEKYAQGHFGSCPRLMCKKYRVLPIGVSDQINQSRVKIYCPKCEEIYQCNKPLNIDGAYFGSGFPFALLQEFPELRPGEEPEAFTPKLFGFKIFGLRGSKYRSVMSSKKFQEDEDGGMKTQEEIERILTEKRTDAYD